MQSIQGDDCNVVFNMDGSSVACCLLYEMASRAIAINTCTGTCNGVWNTMMLFYDFVKGKRGKSLIAIFIANVQVRWVLLLVRKLF